MEFIVCTALLASFCFGFAYWAKRRNRRPVETSTKPKFVVVATTAGVMGCIVVVSVVVGLLSSLASLAASVKRLME